jgi:hypothetical protein
LLQVLCRAQCASSSRWSERLAAQICAVLYRKPRQHEFREAPEKLLRIMASTGG